MQPSDFKVPPVIKTVTYAGSPEDAFDRFAVEIGKWWPMETHSLGKAVDASSISFECLEAGGALVERCKSGDFHVWGSIVDIRHPRPISFTWHVGRPQDTAQLIEVTFDPKENGTTNVNPFGLGEVGRPRVGSSAKL
jgi:uncharacterized protein YndB with AHSA1/START domain